LHFGSVQVSNKKFSILTRRLDPVGNGMPGKRRVHLFNDQPMCSECLSLSNGDQGRLPPLANLASWRREQASGNLGGITKTRLVPLAGLEPARVLAHLILSQVL